MKRTFLSIALLAVAGPAFSQQPAAGGGGTIVAIVNDDAITRERFDGIWSRLHPKLREQYERNAGGRTGFLENYVGKVLVVQEAHRSGFAADPGVVAEVNAAADTALFTAYVRDVASKAVKNDAELKTYYEANLPDLAEQRAKAAEALTPETLENLWSRMSARARQQYETAGGGRPAFREHQVEKLLMIEVARRKGFDASPAVKLEIDAARESALFDAYVRDVVADAVITEEALQRFYDENLPDFTNQEAKLRLIRVPKGDRPGEAREKIAAIMTALIDARTKLASEGRPVSDLKDIFAKMAVAASHDETAEKGGDLGWVRRGMLRPELDAAVFTMPVETTSGILDMDDSFALLFLEERVNRTETFNEVRAAIREYLVGRDAKAIVAALAETTAELRSVAKVETFHDRLD